MSGLRFEREGYIPLYQGMLQGYIIKVQGYIKYDMEEEEEEEEEEENGLLKDGVVDGGGGYYS